MIKAVFFDLIGTLVYAKKTFSFEEVSNYLSSRKAIADAIAKNLKEVVEIIEKSG